MSVQGELLEAAGRGDHAEVTRLLASGARVDAQEQGETALRRAARGGHAEVVAALLAAYAEPPVEDNRWSSALMEACNRGHTATVRLLLDGTRSSESLLESAAAALITHGSVELGLGLVERGASPGEALQEAAEIGAQPAVLALLATGRAAPEAKTEALFRAATGGHVDVVRALIEAGVDSAARDSDGWSAAARAASKGHGSIADLLESAGASTHGLLWAAAESGREALIDRALALGAEVSQPTEAGLTALHHAAQAGHEAVALRLLALGADIEAEDRSGSTPAALAAKAGSLGVLKALADKGATLDRALVAAADGGHEDVVRECLERGASIEARDEYAETALHKAAERGDAGVLRALLANKPKLDRKNINGWTALMRAAGGGHVEAVKLLIARGAAVNYATDPVEETALSWASSRGHLEVVDVLLKAGARILRTGSYRPLMVAAQEGHTAVVARLCDAGAVVDDTKDEQTALSNAARAGHMATVELLLARGAKPSSRAILDAAERGQTAVIGRLLAAGATLPEGFLMKAAEGGQGELVQLALESGCPVDAREGYWQRTPLAAAAAAGSFDAVRVLLDAGADPNARDSERKSPVRLASDRGALDVVRLLVSRGGLAERKELVDHAANGDLAKVKELLEQRANPDVRIELGRTALHEASALGHGAIVSALIGAGASVDLADEDGWTPLLDACDFGHVAIATALLDAGADPFAKDRQDFTAIALAERGGHRAVVELFRAREVDRDWRPDLFQAAREGDRATLERLKNKGRPLGLSEYEGSILHLGAAAGHLDVVRFALENGLPIEGKNNYGATPLFAAASAGHAAVVRELVARGADPSTTDQYKEPAIVNAAARCNADVVRALAAAGAAVDAVDAEGKRALDKAIEYRSDETSVALLEHGARADAAILEQALDRSPVVVWELVRRGLKLPAHSSGARALAVSLWAEGVAAEFDDPGAAMLESAASDDIEVIRALLEHGLDPNARDDDGETPLLRAKSRSDKDIEELLRARGAKAAGGLVKLASSGESITAKAIKAALAEGDQLDTADREGLTALHHAAKAGEEKSVKALLAAKAPLDSLTKDGETPLLLALDKQHFTVVELLAKAGASFTAGSDSVWSAAAHYLRYKDLDRARALVKLGASTKWLMHAAAGSGDRAAVALAAELGAPASVVTAGGFTAARAAAASGAREVLDEVLRLGSSREGVLHGAVDSENAELVRYVLAELGCDIEARDGSGRAALHEAAFGGEALTAMLLDAGANPNATDSDGTTPLFYAADHDNIPVIKLLLSRGANASHTNEAGQTVAGRARWGSAALKSALGIAEPRRSWGGYGGDDEDGASEGDGNDRDD